MSNISIKENGVVKNLTVDKLRTPVESSVTVDWIPEEDMNVATLKVTRNGEYKAEDFDVLGFDVVDVAVTGHGGAGAKLETDPHVGEFNAHDPVIEEGGKGFTMGGVKKIIVDKQGGDTVTFVEDGDVNTSTLSASQNRVYRARSDGKYAYTSVTVNVQSGGGGGGGGDEPYDPDNLPTAIAGGPLNITYEDGETIALRDGDIKAYTTTTNPYGHVDYTLWTHDSYPGGGIPVSELALSDMVAHFNPDGPFVYPYAASGLYLGSGIHQPIIYDNSCYFNSFSSYVDHGERAVLHYQKNTSDCKVGCFLSQRTSNSLIFWMIYAAKEDEPTSYQMTTEYKNTYSDTGEILSQGTDTYTLTLGQNATYNNKRVNYAVGNWIIEHTDTVPYEISAANTVTGSYVDNVNESAVAWTIAYGEEGYEEHKEISVSWPRPYDGQVLNGSFWIFVYPAGQNPLTSREVVGSGGTQQ